MCALAHFWCKSDKFCHFFGLKFWSKKHYFMFMFSKICDKFCHFWNLVTMRALSKADLKPSRANMHGAASLWKEKQTLSLPPTCTQLVLCEKGKFALDGEFSKNAPYKQKIIFHLTSIGKMSRKNFFLPWTVGRWYLLIKLFLAVCSLTIKTF